MEYFKSEELGRFEDVWRPFARLHKPVRFEAGQLIYLQETQADGFYYLSSGRVKTFISSEDGSERVLTVYQAGNLFGEASFFDELPRVSSAMAVTECQVVVISRSDAERTLAENPELSRALLRYLSRTVRMLSTHLDDMAFRPAEERILRYLRSLPRDSEGRVSCTQEEIAAAVSVSRVTVSRTIRRLVKEGTVRTGYGTLRLLRPENMELS